MSEEIYEAERLLIKYMSVAIPLARAAGIIDQLRGREEREELEAAEREAERLKNIPPVDQSARVLSDGSPVTEDHRELRPDGQQKGYVVLSAAERAKGFVRPVRRSYIHVGIDPVMNGHVLIKAGKGGCGTRTSMGIAIAETFARDPGFYTGGTFCCTCETHRPLAEFVWEGTTEVMGS